jgi:hypothetical protein
MTNSLSRHISGAARRARNLQGFDDKDSRSEIAGYLSELKCRDEPLDFGGFVAEVGELLVCSGDDCGRRLVGEGFV